MYNLLREFGARLRSARERAGLTQAELARRVEISASYLGNLERGRRVPRLPLVYALAEAVGVALSELLPALLLVWATIHLG